MKLLVTKRKGVCSACWKKVAKGAEAYFGDVGLLCLQCHQDGLQASGRPNAYRTVCHVCSAVLEPMEGFLSVVEHYDQEQEVYVKTWKATCLAPCVVRQ